MKKHTFPEEQPEMPVEPRRPEIDRPSDPKEPEIPGEDYDNIPQELPGNPQPPHENPPMPPDE